MLVLVEVLGPVLQRLGIVGSEVLDVLDLEARLCRERQFNRKVEINAAIRAAKTQLKRLAAP